MVGALGARDGGGHGEHGLVGLAAVGDVLVDTGSGKWRCRLGAVTAMVGSAMCFGEAQGRG